MLTVLQQIERWIPGLKEEDINLVLNSKTGRLDALINVITYDLLSRMKEAVEQKRFKARNPFVAVSCTSSPLVLVLIILLQVVIFDESHAIKSWKAARTKASMPVIAGARRVKRLSTQNIFVFIFCFPWNSPERFQAILLTGTPALSRPSEIWTQISALCPQLFPPSWRTRFDVRYCSGHQVSIDHTDHRDRSLSLTSAGTVRLG